MDASSQFKDSLPTKPEALMAVLDDLAVDYKVFNHPPLRTVEDSKQLRGEMIGTHVKNLYLRDRKKRNFLLVTEEDRAIDLKNIQGDLGSDRLSFGSADRLFEMLGVRPGAVSPFTIINDPEHKVSLAIDTLLLRAGMLYLHPLVNDMTLGVTPAGLLRFIGHVGHQVNEIDF
jgi:Ala-tRNA(Pro) deacylase